MTNPPIVPVLEKYNWDGRRSGRGPWYKIRCPWHGDRTASAGLNEDDQLFVCHACEIKGNAIDVIKKVEGVTYDEAKRRVQAITGASISELSRGTGGRLVSSKLPAWTRDQRLADRRLSTRRGRRDHS